jgi:hypothetical protein
MIRLCSKICDSTCKTFSCRVIIIIADETLVCECPENLGLFSVCNEETNTELVRDSLLIRKYNRCITAYLPTYLRTYLSN